MRREQSILIIDDDHDILDLISYNLKSAGYKVYTSDNAVEGIQVAKDITPSLIILDVMMPEMDGIEACRIIRGEINLRDTIITFLTARSEDYSQIAGFGAGADDYLAKPIRPRLLLSKIESLLRRVNVDNEEKSKDLVIDREKFVVELNGDKIILPKKEFELLELLSSRPGKVFNREQILSFVWGNDTIVGERTIDVHIRKLREKLGNHYIRTIKGVGYTFSEI